MPRMIRSLWMRIDVYRPNAISTRPLSRTVYARCEEEEAGEVESIGQASPSLHLPRGLGMTTMEDLIEITASDRRSLKRVAKRELGDFLGSMSQPDTLLVRVPREDHGSLYGHR
ncbi:hypothetical protein PM082_015313 [Marasmius tenuissimus]|nr:hypothetical protein PM082_015313 [Marasmius tenuissimus]